MNQRFPRTLDEAFGPHTSKEIESPKYGLSESEKLVCWIIGTIIGCIGLVAFAQHFYGA